MNIINIKSILLITCFFSLKLFSQVTPLNYGLNSLSKSIDKKEIKIDIQISNSEIKLPDFASGLGVVGGAKTKIEKLSILVQGEEIFVPWDAYFLIFSARNASIRKFQDRYNLIIDGGDAAEIYTIIFEFNSKRLLKKVATSHLFGLDTRIETYFKSKIYDKNQLITD